MKNITGERALQRILDVIPNPVILKNRNHQIVLLNASACTLLGHSREVLLTFPDTDLFPADQVRIFRAADNRVFELGVTDENEEEVTDGAGKVRHVITRKGLVRLGGEDLVIGIVTDVTARREAEARSRYLAFHDALTGLPNRALLDERIDQALLRARRGKQRCALIYIDLDQFKHVNDAHGHFAGDALIRDFGSRLSEIVRASDTVARLGGDEFAILMPAVSGANEVENVCERILAAAGRGFQLSAGLVFVGASIGMAFAEGTSLGQVELQRRADVALYEAKKEGRGCWRVFNREIDDVIQQRRRLEGEMRTALAAGTGFEVHYQPLFAIRGEAVVGVEALVRWRHERLGLLLPEKFIQIAEESGLIVALGDVVLRQALAMVGRWPDLNVAVNFSPVQLRTSGLAERVLAAVAATGVSAGRLQLEVTETSMLDVDRVTTETLKTLRAAGIQIVLDDFGTGYSSLSHLHTLAIDKVKIDRSFVQQLGVTDGAGAIIRAVAALCSELGISVTAEGVETDAQRAYLRLSKCSELQGYLLSPPLPEAEAAAFLDAALAPTGRHLHIVPPVPNADATWGRKAARPNRHSSSSGPIRRCAIKTSSEFRLQAKRCRLVAARYSGEAGAPLMELALDMERRADILDGVEGRVPDVVPA